MTMKMRARSAGVLTAAAFAIVIGAVVHDEGVSAADPWVHTVAIQRAPVGETSFELWTRWDAAVLVASVDGQRVHESRCDRDRLVSRSAGSVSIVIREGLATAQCIEWATDPLLDYARAAEKLAMERMATADGTVTFESATGPIRRLVRTAMGLPLLADLATGETLRWDYPEDPAVPAIPPPLDESEALERETYRNLDLSAAARNLGLGSVPPELGGLPLETVFSYDASTAKGTAFYAIWRGDDGREIQLTVTPAVAPHDVLGLVDAGTLSLQEGQNNVRIVAPDPALLRVAVEALRPASMDQLGSP